MLWYGTMTCIVPYSHSGMYVGAAEPFDSPKLIATSSIYGVLPYHTSVTDVK